MSLSTLFDSSSMLDLRSSERGATLAGRYGARGASPLSLTKQSLQKTGFLPLGRKGTSHTFPQCAQVAECSSVGRGKSLRSPRLANGLEKSRVLFAPNRPPFLKSFIPSTI